MPPHTIRGATVGPPSQAARGYSANPYGDEAQHPLRSGVANFANSLSFAAELQENVDEDEDDDLEELEYDYIDELAYESEQIYPDRTQSVGPLLRRTRDSTVHANRSSPLDRHRTPRSRLPSHRSSISMSSGSPQRTPNVLSSPPAPDSIPSGGVRYRKRKFDFPHEAGLELPRRPPGPVLLMRQIFHLLTQSVFAFLCAFVFFVVCIWLYVALKGDPRNFDNPSGSTDGKPITSKNQTVTTPSPRSYTISSKSLKSTPTNHNPPMLQEIRDDIRGVKTQLQTVSEQVQSLEAWRTASQRPNFFSPKLGAFIDPVYTSPTNRRGVSKIRQYYHLWRYLLSLQTAEYLPPTKILKARTDIADCWCAVDAPFGHLSVGVYLGQPIYPRALIVDYVPKAATLNQLATPKRIDVWARLVAGTDPATIPPPWSDNQKGCESPEPLGETKWVCLGKMKYNIDDPSPTQSLSLTGYYSAPPFKVDRVAVRVLENYGSPYTCLYQLKLEGWVNADEE